jgi:hypothetical protein
MRARPSAGPAPFPVLGRELLLFEDQQLRAVLGAAAFEPGNSEAHRSVLACNDKVGHLPRLDPLHDRKELGTFEIEAAGVEYIRLTRSPNRGAWLYGLYSFGLSRCPSGPHFFARPPGRAFLPEQRSGGSGLAVSGWQVSAERGGGRWGG